MEWSRVTSDKLVYILGKLANLERMTVHEIFSGNPGKDYDVDRLPSPKARECLVELRLDDQTQISRIQLSGTERLYGFRRANVFHVLWWDPDHTVWPSGRT